MHIIEMETPVRKRIPLTQLKRGQMAIVRGGSKDGQVVIRAHNGTCVLLTDGDCWSQATYGVTVEPLDVGTRFNVTVGYMAYECYPVS